MKEIRNFRVISNAGCVDCGNIMNEFGGCALCASRESVNQSIFVQNDVAKFGWSQMLSGIAAFGLIALLTVLFLAYCEVPAQARFQKQQTIARGER